MIEPLMMMKIEQRGSAITRTEQQEGFRPRLKDFRASNKGFDLRFRVLELQTGLSSYVSGYSDLEMEFRAWVQGGGSVITGSPSVVVAMGFEVDIMKGGSAMDNGWQGSWRRPMIVDCSSMVVVFLDLAEKDMRQINALFRELEVVKSKIRASQSKEEAESLKFSEKHLINKQYNNIHNCIPSDAYCD
ncbi:hypothetical protein RHGRI_012829 [Rhododendron griersonianum]|uniref:Uncharacterized protein n=1 Tax=Rhododendron griersonianum TaxID=479676 RepID=A0AAV6KSF4_9ERIC|nr:hypothetical protein RHGRI_012829 [Rhododendron griersonianum]